MNPSGSLTLTGTGDQHGNNEGSVYGDDAQMATNYPIVTFTSTTGVVSFATTSGFNYMEEQGSKPLTTNFTPPAGLISGTYSVRVIANRAASAAPAAHHPRRRRLPGPTIATPAAATPNPVFATTTQLSVLGADAKGESTLTYTWSTTSSPAGVAAPTFAINGTNAAKNDKVTFHGEGNYTFQVTVTNATGVSITSTTTVTVNPSLSSFSISPTKAQIAAGQTAQFIASGLDQFGNQINSSAAFVFSVTSGGGTVSQTGLYTAPATGTIATVSVRVNNSTLNLSATVYVLSNPWVQTDIGTPKIGGNAADNGAGLFTLLGAGTGISATSDQSQFAFLTVSGNSTIQAQVATIQNTNSAAEAGVMFRNDASAGSPNVMIGITPNNGLVFSYRTLLNGPTTTLTASRVTAGYYVKLVRVGWLLHRILFSPNGVTWTVAASQHQSRGEIHDGRRRD